MRKGARTLTSIVFYAILTTGEEPDLLRPGQRIIFGMTVFLGMLGAVIFYALPERLSALQKPHKRSASVN